MMTHLQLVSRVKVRSGLNTSLSRVYGVRWEDEDRGWQTAAVLATSPQSAREVIEGIVPHALNLVVLQ